MFGAALTEATLGDHVLHLTHPSGYRVHDPVYDAVVETWDDGPSLDPDLVDEEASGSLEVEEVVIVNGVIPKNSVTMFAFLNRLPGTDRAAFHAVLARPPRPDCRASARSSPLRAEPSGAATRADTTAWRRHGSTISMRCARQPARPTGTHPRRRAELHGVGPASVRRVHTRPLRRNLAVSRRQSRRRHGRGVGHRAGHRPGVRRGGHDESCWPTSAETRSRRQWTT